MRHDLFQTHRFSHLRTLCGAARRLTRTTTYSIHGVRCGSWWYKIQSVGLWMARSRHWQHVDSISERHRLVNWDGWNKEYGAKSIAREFADGSIARRLAFSDRCLPECESEIQQFRLAIYPICRFVTGTRWQALGRGKVSSRHPELTASHTNLSAVGSS